MVARTDSSIKILNPAEASVCTLEKSAINSTDASDCSVNDSCRGVGRDDQSVDVPVSSVVQARIKNASGCMRRRRSAWKKSGRRERRV